MDEADEQGSLLDHADIKVEQALAALRAALQERVRTEQLHDQLTGLPNGAARDEWIDRMIEAGNSFWVAFIEVDRFKSINDKHGYQSADLLLQWLAKSLQEACSGHRMPQLTVPFRAHGDEFYLAGKAPEPFDADGLHQRLDHVRSGIELLRVPSVEAEAMEATVSIGWVLSDDIGELERVPVLQSLERAVDHAKGSGRNCVVRFDETMRKRTTIDDRADCKTCRTKFALSVPLEARRETALVCPNCGDPILRPHSLHPAATESV